MCNLTKTYSSIHLVQALLKPIPSELMMAHEIPKRINKPKYEAPDCNAPWRSGEWKPLDWNDLTNVLVFVEPTPNDLRYKSL